MSLLSKLAVGALVGALVTIVATSHGRTADIQNRSSSVRTNARHGLVVYLGCGDGRTMLDQARGGNVVHGLTVDEAETAKLRSFFQLRGMYGRVSVRTLASAKALPYADNLVNLVVVPDSSVISQLQAPINEIVRVLCPDGRAMLAHRAAATLAETREKLLSALRNNPSIAEVTTVDEGGSWLIIRKSRPAGMGEWTHFRYGPEGNAVSPDRLVGVPNSLRWVAESAAWPKTHFDHIFAAVSAGGRLFCIFDESPPGFQVPRQLVLIARNAYNGLLLWKRPLPAKLIAQEWRHGKRRDAWMVDNLVAVDGFVFVPDLGKVLKLDAATGQVVAIYKDLTPSQLIVTKGRLFVTGSDKRTPLQCLDIATGKRRWTYRNPVEHFVCGSNRVFFVDADRQTVCLDADTGQTIWRKDYQREWPDITRLKFRRVVSCNEHVLVTAGQTRQAHVCALQGVSTLDGRHLWSFEYTDPFHNFGNSVKNAFILDGLVWVNRRTPGGITNETAWVGLDWSTGQIKKEIRYGPVIHRCRPAQASGRFFFCGSFDVCDRRTGAFYRIRAARNSCGFGVLPANGLVYTFPQSCECDAYLRGFLAFASSESNWPSEVQTARGHETLVKGPAFEWATEQRGRRPAKAVTNASREQWPCYRHDGRRSGATEAFVPCDLKRKWITPIVPVAAERRPSAGCPQPDTGPITAPTAAGGMVFVAVKDRHQVVALDAASGEERWRFTAGGRIDSPPTTCGELCLFGSHDGWIYCLRTEDGALVWRFRAAPADRLIVVDEQLESAWPVSGSVLVENDVCYAAAGRHTQLDGGLIVYALDPWTGKVIWKTRRPRKEQKNFDRCHVMRMAWVEKGTPTWWGTNPRPDFCYRVSYQEPVSLGGLLASDGESVYLGPWPYGPPRQAPEDEDDNFIQTKNGFFDASWNFRNWWMDKRVGGHLLSFNKRRTFAIRMKGFAHRWTYRSPLHRPGSGFELLAVSKPIPTEFFLLKSRLSVPADWVREIKIAGDAMALCRTTLFVAGAPDGDRLKATGAAGLLEVYSPQTGAGLREFVLPAPPVFDGLAATEGRLYLSLKNGTLAAFTAESR